jgi:diketogulonate reductase-like aldo/keto reductase
MHDILARDNIPLAVNQVEYSILRQLPEKSGLLEEMKKRNVTCLGCTSGIDLNSQCR